MLLRVLFSLGVVVLAAPADPVSVMGANVLPRTDLIVRGHPGKRTRLGIGAAITVFSVDEVVLGTESSKSLLVLSADADFFGPADVPTVAFLHRLSGGRYEGVQRMDLAGEDAEVKLKALRSYLEIEAMKDPDKKRAAFHDLLMAHLGASERFLIWSAARELAHFTEKNADRFDAADVALIRARATGTSEPLLRQLLHTVLEHLGAEKVAKTDVPTKVEVPVDSHGLPAPREFRKMLAAWHAGVDSADDRLRIVRAAGADYLKFGEKLLLEALGDEDPRVREAAATGLGEGLFDAGKKPLLALLVREKDPHVVRAAIQSLGYLECEAALPTILAFGRNRDLRRTVIFAAARIGGTLAHEWLAAQRAGATGDAPEAVRLRATLDFVASEAFARQEAALKKLRRARLR